MRQFELTPAKTRQRHQIVTRLNEPPLLEKSCEQSEDGAVNTGRNSSSSPKYSAKVIKSYELRIS